MIRFTQKQNYRLFFQATVGGKITADDVTGALFSWTAEVIPEYSLTKLQNNKIIGKIQIYIRHKKNAAGKDISQVQIQVPHSGTKLQASLCIGLIQTLPKINLYPVKINFVKIVESKKDLSSLIIKRALDVYRTSFSSSAAGVTNLENALEDLVSQKPMSSIGGFTLGSSFKQANEVIIVEGRRDVARLAQASIQNTLGVGGFNFSEEQLRPLVEGKRLTLMFDGDRGGEALKEKVIAAYRDLIAYVVTMNNGQNVEDLASSEIVARLGSKVPYIPA